MKYTARLVRQEHAEEVEIAEAAEPLWFRLQCVQSLTSVPPLESSDSDSSSDSNHNFLQRQRAWDFDAVLLSVTDSLLEHDAVVAAKAAAAKAAAKAQKRGCTTNPAGRMGAGQQTGAGAPALATAGGSGGGGSGQQTQRQSPIEFAGWRQSVFERLTASDVRRMQDAAAQVLEARVQSAQASSSGGGDGGGGGGGSASSWTSSWRWWPATPSRTTGKSFFCFIPSLTPQFNTFGSKLTH